MECTQPLNLGFSVADATSPALDLEGQVLTVRFVDWTDQRVTVMCNDAVAVRWQEADRYIDENDRYDGTFVVQNSGWLAEHNRQQVLFGPQEFRHVQMNFNAAGILEVLCTRIEVVRTAWS